MKYFVLVFTILFSFSVYAKDDASGAGNGGDGVWSKGKLRLLDFVEGGIENSPYFDSKIKANPVFLKLVQDSIPFKGVPTKKIAAKLTEIHREHPRIGVLLAQGIAAYKWAMVNRPYKDLLDEKTAIDGKKVQLAVRSGQRVGVYRSSWKLLDEENRTGLIFHEVTSGLMVPRLVDRVLGFFEQNAPKAREINGYFFTEDLREQGFWGLEQVIAGELPFDELGVLPFMIGGNRNRIYGGGLEFRYTGCSLDCLWTEFKIEQGTEEFKDPTTVVENLCHKIYSAKNLSCLKQRGTKLSTLSFYVFFNNDYAMEFSQYLSKDGYLTYLKPTKLNENKHPSMGYEFSTTSPRWDVSTEAQCMKWGKDAFQFGKGRLVLPGFSEGF